MKKRYYTIVVLLIVSHLLTELHTFMMWINPQLISVYSDKWFIKPGFKIDHLNVLWFVKMIEDSLLLISIIFAGACQAFSKNYETFLQWQRYSFRLYLIWIIYFLYHCFDFFMFMYDYKTSYRLYILILSIATISASFIGFSNKKRFFRD